MANKKQVDNPQKDMITQQAGLGTTYINTKLGKVKMPSINSTNTTPDFIKKPGNVVIPYGQVESGAKAGSYPEKLIFLYQNSEYHSTIINTKVNLTVGGELTFDKEGEDPVKIAMTEKYIANVNGQDSLQEVFEKAELDRQVFGGAAYLITWSNDWTIPVYIQHSPWYKLRVKEKNLDNKVDTIFYSNDWSTQKAKKIAYKLFDTRVAEQNAQLYQVAIKNNDVELLTSLANTTQIVYDANYTLGREYYPYPEYTAAIDSIESSILVSNHFKNSLENGFSAGTILTLVGNYSDEDLNTNAEDIEESYVGSVRAGGTMTLAAADKDHMPEIHRIEPRQEDALIAQILEESTNRILTVHGSTNRTIFGLTAPGQLGGTDDIKAAMDVLYTNKIKPAQISLVKPINKVLMAMNLIPVYFTRIDDTDVANASTQVDEVTDGAQNAEEQNNEV